MTALEELKKDLKRNVVFGTRRTLKLLKEGKIEKIYLSSDAPIEIEKLKGVKIIRMKQGQEELKEICKKKFNVSVISVLKE